MACDKCGWSQGMELYSDPIVCTERNTIHKNRDIINGGKKYGIEGHVFL